MNAFAPSPSGNPLLIELTGEEHQLLNDIRQRKARLVSEIRQLTCEINNIANDQSIDDRIDLHRKSIESIQFTSQPEVIAHMINQSINDTNDAKDVNVARNAQNTQNAQDAQDANDRQHKHLSGNQMTIISQILLQCQSGTQTSTEINLIRSRQEAPLINWNDRHIKPIASVKPMIISTPKADAHGATSKVSISNAIKPEVSHAPANKLIDTNTSDADFDDACQMFNQHSSSSACIPSIMHLIKGQSASHLARFLFHTTGLSKQAIGHFLGQPHDFNQQTLNEFVRLHDFRHKSPETALREFLANFRLPGEAQQIQRFLEPFAQHYCEQNAGRFEHQDQLFLLSYTLLMLNTLRHRPEVRAKLSRNRFYAMNKGVNRTLLKQAYNSVCRHPFQVPDEPATVSKPVPGAKRDHDHRSSPVLTCSHTYLPNKHIEGWLWKQSSSTLQITARWTRRWFVLNQRCLLYFAGPADPEPQGIIPLENVELHVRHHGNRNAEQHPKSKTLSLASRWLGHCVAFSICPAQGAGPLVKACRKDRHGRFVQSAHAQFRFAMDHHCAVASDCASMVVWTQAIQSNITHNPYLEMLLARRRKYA